MSGERYLLVITKNNSSVVVECVASSSLDRLRSEAESNGAVCKRILIEDLYPTYRGDRYFDLGNPVTRKSFSMAAIIGILDAPLEDLGEAEDLFGGNIFH